MSGYVYLLMNPSYTGMLKIGKTTKLPEERVKELSSATGVPTPFVLLYSIRVSDCDYVEKSIHQELEHLGFRNSKNREFFNIDIQNAIKVFQRYEEAFQEKCEDLFEDDQDGLIDFFKKNGTRCLAAKPFLDQASQELRENKKIKLLEKALKLRCIEAGIELSLNLDIKSDSKLLDYRLETYQLIESVSNDEEYKFDVMLYSKPKIPQILLKAIFLAYNIEEFNLFKKLISIYYEEIKVTLNYIVLPALIDIINSKDSADVIQCCIDTYYIDFHAREFLKILLELDENINIHDESKLFLEMEDEPYNIFERLSELYSELANEVITYITILLREFSSTYYPINIIEYLFNEETRDIVTIFKAYFDIDQLSLYPSDWISDKNGRFYGSAISGNELHLQLSQKCAEYLENNF